MKRIVNVLNEANRGTRAFPVVAMYMAVAIASPASIPHHSGEFQRDQRRANRNGYDSHPATNGNFYRYVPRRRQRITRLWHGPSEITPAASFTTIYNFCSKQVPAPRDRRDLGCADGAGPLAGLVQGANGGFYGQRLSAGLPADPMGPGGTVFQNHREWRADHPLQLLLAN